MRDCPYCGDANPGQAIHCLTCGKALLEPAPAAQERRAAVHRLRRTRRRKPRIDLSGRTHCAWCGAKLPCLEHADLDQLLEVDW